MTITFHGKLDLNTEGPSITIYTIFYYCIKYVYSEKTHSCRNWKLCINDILKTLKTISCDDTCTLLYVNNFSRFSKIGFSFKNNILHTNMKIIVKVKSVSNDTWNYRWTTSKSVSTDTWNYRWTTSKSVSTDTWNYRWTTSKVLTHETTDEQHLKCYQIYISYNYE